MGYQYVDIGASCSPRPLQTKRDASQVASIHLSNDKTIELDNVCYWVLSHKTTGWMRSLHIFLNIVSTRFEISQYEKITQFWKWSAARVIIQIKGTGSFVPAIFGYLEFRRSIKHQSFQSC